MKDELLMKFIDGTATADEVETVMDVLCRDDEMAREWLQMVQAAKLADTAPAVRITEGEALERVSRRMKKPMRPYWLLGSIAAAAALALMLMVPFRQKGGINAGDDFVAQLPEDTISGVESIDSLVHEKPLSGREEYVADVVDIPSQEVAHESVVPHQDNVSTASRIEIVSDFRMIKPAKSPYRVRVRNLDNEFVFEWEGQGISKITIAISDPTGTTLMEKMLEGDSFGCSVKVSELINKGELDWTIKSECDNAVTFTETGKIEFVYIP